MSEIEAWRVNDAPQIERQLASKTRTRLWEQVAETISVELSVKPDGSRLPSEAQLGARFGVSRVTLRQALLHLQARGLVESHPGLGWFVSLANDAHQNLPKTSMVGGTQLFEPSGRLISFTAMAESRGLVPDSIVLDMRISPSTFSEAEALAIAPGASLFRLRRLRRLGFLPIAIDESRVPAELLPNGMATDFSHASLHELFRSEKIILRTSSVEVEAISADSTQSRLLEIEKGFPLLKVRQVFLDTSNRVIDLGEIVYRSDRYRFRTKMYS